MVAFALLVAAVAALLVVLLRRVARRHRERFTMPIVGGVTLEVHLPSLTGSAMVGDEVREVFVTRRRLPGRWERRQGGEWEALHPAICEPLEGAWKRYSARPS